MIPGPSRRGPGRRIRLLRLARRLGLLGLLERLGRRAGLLVVNYHRVCEPHGTAFDRGVVDATAEDLSRQVSWLREHFRMATLEEAQDLVDRPAWLREPTALVTFDDGYRDNHDVAFPILRRAGVPAAFFLATAFVGTRLLPWWDRIAELARRCAGRTLSLGYPRPTQVRVEGDGEGAIRELLRLYKDPATAEPARLLSDLERAAGAPLREQSDERLFLDWTEAREMLAAGMSFGSHTHTHGLLARMSAAEQREELSRSRELIRRNLGIACTALAYPVGSPAAFSSATREALTATGYRTAFSYHGGTNLPQGIDRFDVQRIATDPELGMDGYRMRALLTSAWGLRWP